MRRNWTRLFASLLLTIFNRILVTKCATNKALFKSQVGEIRLTPNCSVERDVQLPSGQQREYLWRGRPVWTHEDCALKCAHKAYCTSIAFNNKTNVCALFSPKSINKGGVTKLEHEYTDFLKITCYDHDFCILNPDSPICTGVVVKQGAPSKSNFRSLRQQ